MITKRKDGRKASSFTGTMTLSAGEAEERLDNVLGGPERSLIDYLCDKVLRNFSINKRALYNWQIELSDISQDSTSLTSIIELDILIAVPSIADYYTPEKEEVQQFLDRLDKLGDLYLVLKAILFELFICASTVLYKFKLLLFRSGIPRICLDKFLSLLQIDSDVENDSLLILGQYARLIVEFSEFGLSIKDVRKLVLPLFQDSLPVLKKAFIVDMMLDITTSYPTHFKSLVFSDFRHTAIPLPLAGDLASLKCFTILTSIKINRNQLVKENAISSPELDLFILTSSTCQDSCALKIKLINYTQIAATLEDELNRNIKRYIFNQHLNDMYQLEQNYAQITLTFDSYAHLNLFINGEYSESLACFDMLKVMDSWSKIYIGSNQGQNANEGDELLLRSLLIYNVALPVEWVSFIYNTSLEQEWDSGSIRTEMIYDSLNQMSYRNFFNLHIKTRELKDNKRKFNTFRNHEFDESGRNSNKSKYLFDISHSKKNKVFVASMLGSFNLSSENVIFDLGNTFMFTESANIAKVCFHEPVPFHDALYAIGGVQIILYLLENLAYRSETKRTQKDTLLHKIMSLLLTILNNNWRLNKEFENSSGYGLLLILLNKYQFNSKRKIEDSPEETTEYNSQNCLLELILSHIGINSLNPYESVILNTAAYNFLISNFELFIEGCNLNLLFGHMRSVTIESKFSAANSLELIRLRTLKKIIQFLKTPSSIAVVNNDSFYDSIYSAVNCLIRIDSSVESIRTVSFFIIYLLYHNTLRASHKLGYTVLRSITEVLCCNTSMKTLKKFSRSINLHWILLILSFKSEVFEKSGEVVKCGIRFLTQLLLSLGPQTIKRFFHSNSGRDILTMTLKDRWREDKILNLLLLSAFGVEFSKKTDHEAPLVEMLQKNPRIMKMKSLEMPDMVLILGNISISSISSVRSIYEKPLGQSPRKSKNEEEDMVIAFDALHLANELIGFVDYGFQKSIALSLFFTSCEWLELIIEYMSHLRIITTCEIPHLGHGFKNAHKSLVEVISNIFASKLMNSGQFFSMFESLSDLTKKIVFELIFPQLFKHSFEFMNSSNVIFVEKGFSNTVVHILNCYCDDFLAQKYKVDSGNINMFVDCSSLIIEDFEQKKLIIVANHNLRRLKKNLGTVIVTKIISDFEKFKDLGSKSAQSTPDSKRISRSIEKQSELSSTLDSILKWLLYRQMIFFQIEVLDNTKLAHVISLIVGAYFVSESQSNVDEHLFNCLRNCYMMRQEHFKEILHGILDPEYSEAEGVILDFFEQIITKNDDDARKHLFRFPIIKSTFTKSFTRLIGQFTETSSLYIEDMLQVLLDNGGILGLSDNIHVLNSKKDCDRLKNSINKSELVKYNIALQDRQENNQYFVSNYNYLKIEVTRLLRANSLSNYHYSSYILDYIQNYDCMRKRMIIENQLPESEKLSYEMDIPMKQVEDFSDFAVLDDYDLNNDRLDNMYISNEGGLLDCPEDSYEFVEGLSEELPTQNSTHEDKNRKVIRSLFLGDQILFIWNVSQINGLVPIESIMILGTNHLYLIENYFHCQDGNVIDAEDAPFEQRDPYLQLINFQTKDNSKLDMAKPHRVKSWGILKLSSISKRQFLLRDIAIEMFFSDGASILITSLSPKERDHIYQKLSTRVTGLGLDNDLIKALQLSSNLSSNYNLNHGTAYFTSKIASAFSNTSSLFNITKKWKSGLMSNFYYLMCINMLSGRTFNDLTQYPVFPWVIADYTSTKLDLTNPKTFRDLSKPMGGQTEHRASQFKERYEALDSLDDSNTPPFHYGTHYSSAMIVTSYLIRLKPYVQSYLLLQGGKFDHANRLFNSIEKSWNSASRDHTTDVRELIPEFFYLPEFLVNSGHFEFGMTQDGKKLNDVILPPWAKDDPKIFIYKNREALESPYVSANLHSWIELIFGHKQSGPEAVNALNVFHHSSYNGAINLDSIHDEVERRAITGMINNFGQTPTKIFQKPHPPKSVLNVASNYLNFFEKKKYPKLIFEAKSKFPVRKLELSKKNKKWVGRPELVSFDKELSIQRMNKLGSSNGLLVNNCAFFNLHLTKITKILQIGQNYFLTASSDGIINAWRCDVDPRINLQFQCVLRGHFSEIIDLTYSRSFRTAVSLDIEERIILWDLTRFKFIREIFVSPGTPKRITQAKISDDTGNIGVMHNEKDTSNLSLFTINGELILTEDLGKDTISAFCFGSVAKCLLEDESSQAVDSHVHWSNEIIALSNSSNHCVSIFELVSDNENSWILQLIKEIPLDPSIASEITCLHLQKQSNLDPIDRLVRGNLELILGDSEGKVYRW